MGSLYLGTPRRSGFSRRDARGTRHRPLVERAGTARPGASSRIRRPAAGPPRPASPAGPGRRGACAARSRSASASPGGTSSASRSARDTVRYPSMSDATSAVPAAMASSSTTPNDSPSSAGKQAMVAPRSRACFSSSETCPSHSTRGTPRPRSISWWGPSPTTQRSASRSSPAKASSNNARPLRRSWRPTNRIAGAGAGVTRACGEVDHVDPVGQDLAVAPERLGDLAPGVFRHRGRHRQAPHHRPQPRAEGLVPTVATGARRVERADGGHGGADERGMVRPGRKRLVEVQHVGPECAERLDRAPGHGTTSSRSARPTRCSAAGCSDRPW